MTAHSLFDFISLMRDLELGILGQPPARPIPGPATAVQLVAEAALPLAVIGSVP
jgi:hypothetical protein